MIDRVSGMGSATGESDMFVLHIRRGFHQWRSVRCEGIEENVVETLGEFELASSGPEEPFPCLAFAFEASNDVRDADSVLKTVLESKVEEVGNVVDKAIAGSSMEDLVLGVTEGYALSLIHI